jgi:hypothetical protein
VLPSFDDLTESRAGVHDELRAGTLILAGLCVLYYAFGLPH